MDNLNKLVYIHYNLKLRSRNRRRRAFEDQQDYFCPINLDYIFSAEDDLLGEWLEEVEEPLLDNDPELAEMVEDLTGNQFEQMKASERLQEINLAQQRRGTTVDPTEARGKEVGEESESSISTSSSSAGIPPDSPGTGGHYDDDPPLYETVEHFPGASDRDPHRGYVRYVSQTETEIGSSIGQRGGEGTSAGNVGQQQDMYGYNPHWRTQLPLVPPSQPWYEQGMIQREPQQATFVPHEVFNLNLGPQSSQSTEDSSSYYEGIFAPQQQYQYGQGYGSAMGEFGSYYYNRYGPYQRTRNDDDDDIKPGRHFTLN